MIYDLIGGVLHERDWSTDQPFALLERYQMSTQRYAQARTIHSKQNGYQHK